ncbi:type I-E CRISPR-associated protein Cas6/Cse3/CasE [Kitasatospora sp. NBC_00240]|uniref:type I-E CRISPR-associated protein Cas6/Cse3/CasE n=1 Tax=Kitasatospora sp. NBC_00240 TaxID=2903567 RepID=UPI002257F89D|nr:type I-E CRISPR-associated protein Cas6/Cse3/CasE [Kitasatospora sp. NBC_00240]MCX5215398.1 type I-E CRISPR-associated protein Cas6/Cse3/CasE [Kitasatospora sp. NBC_00240]
MGSPQAMHAAVAGATALYDDPGRSLWRLDADAPHRPVLLVLTQVEADFTHIVEQAGWPNVAAGRPQGRDCGGLLSRVEAGQRYRFRVTANPVQTMASQPSGTGDGSSGVPRERGRVLGHRTAAHQSRWFLERTARWGFEVPRTGVGEEPDMRILHRERLSFGKEKGAQRVSLQTATFEGVLTVTEPKVLVDALTVGVAGRGRTGAVC